MGARTKIFEWLNRYGLAECAGITCALIGSFVARRATGSAIAAAYGGAWGETIGYSSVIITRDWLAETRAAHAGRQTVGVRNVAKVATGLLAEFGPAGMLDTFITRPLAMGLGARLLGPQLGLVAGKLAADLVFYLPVIVMYERRKRYHLG